MKYLRKKALLPLLVLGSGILGAFARVGLYALGTDTSDLLVRDHPLHILCWILTLLVAVACAATVWKLDGSNSYHLNFPVSKTAPAPTIVSACGLLAAAVQNLGQMHNGLETVRVAVGLLAAPALAFTGYCRLKGKRPAFFFHAALCLFYGVHLLCQYRIWSGNPQLPDYDFQLLACVFLMLTAYQHTAFTVGLGRRRMLLFCGLMAAHLSFLSCISSGFPLLYLTSGAWALGSLYPLDPPRRKEQEEV